MGHQLRGVERWVGPVRRIDPLEGVGGGEGQSSRSFLVPNSEATP